MSTDIQRCSSTGQLLLVWMTHFSSKHLLALKPTSSARPPRLPPQQSVLLVRIRVWDGNGSFYHSLNLFCVCNSARKDRGAERNLKTDKSKCLWLGSPWLEKIERLWPAVILTQLSWRSTQTCSLPVCWKCQGLRDITQHTETWFHIDWNENHRISQSVIEEATEKYVFLTMQYVLMFVRSFDSWCGKINLSCK